MNETLELLFPHHFYITHTNTFLLTHIIFLCVSALSDLIFIMLFFRQKGGEKRKEKAKTFRNIAPIIL